MGKKSNSGLRKANGYNYSTDDVSRLRDLYVTKKEKSEPTYTDTEVRTYKRKRG